MKHELQNKNNVCEHSQNTDVQGVFFFPQNKVHLNSKYHSKFEFQVTDTQNG